MRTTEREYLWEREGVRGETDVNRSTRYDLLTPSTQRNLGEEGLDKPHSFYSSFRVFLSLISIFRQLQSINQFVALTKLIISVGGVWNNVHHQYHLMIFLLFRLHILSHNVITKYWHYLTLDLKTLQQMLFRTVT